MEKYQHLKSFISAVVEYTKHPSEATTSALQRNLGIIGVSLDLSIFDPGSSIAAEFYVSLYELMNVLDSRTPLTWSALDVLQNACRNGAARRALIHTYKFAPILTRLLEANLTPEKRVRVLKLLQELTYGVKLSWQEAHLPYLISSLTQWVMQSKDEKIVALSLGTLVNLCYKNLSAVYTLMRTVDAKTFMRTLLKIHSNNANTRVQCCKLIIIMESTNNSIPAGHILEFVAMTFSSIVTALKDRDVLLLRHIVDFFVDASQVEHSKAVIVNYQHYVTDVEKILSTIDRDSEHECVALVMEFLLSLASLKISSLIPLYPMCVKIAMSWIPSELVCSKALALIRTVVIDSRISKSSPQVLAELDLSVLMLVANCQEDDEMDGKSEIRSAETQTRLTELMQLLQEMARIPSLKNKVTQTFGEQSMRKLLKPMLEQKDLSAAGEWPGNSFNDPSISLYVHALALTADLAAHDSVWLTLYSEILQKKQIQMVMAMALYTGGFEVKQKVLQLTSSVGFPQECMSSVSRCMCELEPLVLIQNVAGTVPPMNGKYPTNSQNVEMAPLLSFNQESRLDAFLAKLEEAYNNNRIADITTSAVMELYDYKLAAIRHAERATQASLEAANNHATSLQHRLAQVVAESRRLHQLLFHNQQCLEGVRAENATLSATLQTKIEKIQEIPKLKKIVADKSAKIESNNLVIADLKKQLETTTSKLDASTRKITQLEDALSSAEAAAKQSAITVSDLKKQIKKIQENLHKKEQLIAEKELEIASNQEGISALKMEIDQLTSQCRANEQTIAEKEASVQKLTSELGELGRMTDMIHQLTAAMKKDEQNATA